MKSIARVFISLVLLLPASTAFGDLGDSLSKAKSKATYYKSKYDAVTPIFKTNNNGIVNWECWAAPPREWSEKEALTFAIDLLPKSLKTETPQKGKKDGTYYPYSFSDGAMIILSGFQSSYLGVEVRAPGYDGPRC